MNSCVFIFLQDLLWSLFWVRAILTGAQYYASADLIGIYLMICKMEIISEILFAMYISPLEKFLLKALAYV